MITKPLEGEYAPYFLKYIDLVPDEVDILEFLEDTIMDTEDLLSKIPLSNKNIVMQMANGPSKKFCNISSIRNAYLRIALCVLHEKIKPHCPVMTKMNTQLKVLPIIEAWIRC